MARVYKFPTNVEMDVTTQEYVRDHEKMLGEEILPIKECETQRVEWDELDNETGKTAAHNMDNDPRVKSRPGSKRKSYEPIPHKESEVVKESELLNARAFGTLGNTINIDTLVMERFNSRIQKDHVTKESEIWQALQGALNIDENGVKVSETFPVQEYEALVDWTDHDLATPLADSNAEALLFRGTGASAQGAIKYMNQVTFNHLLENANGKDIRGFNTGLQQVNFDLEAINKINQKRGLPIIKVYDEGWYDDDEDFQLFIPDGVAITIGKRQMGQKVGDFCLTPSLHRTKNGQPASGFFAFIEVNGRPNKGGIATEDLGGAGNPQIKVTSGYYGGPRIKYPRSVIKSVYF